MVLLAATLAAAADADLRIEILEGSGAINNIRLRTAREPVVQVLDAAGAAVSGSTVTFMLPSVGAGGEFPGGSKVLTVQTDENGRAVGRGLRPNAVAGEFTIRVNATHSGQRASATINQTNAPGAAAASPKRGRTFLILALVGGGVAGAVAAAAGGGGSSGGSNPPPASPPTGTVTPGTPTIGSPR